MIKFFTDYINLAHFYFYKLDLRRHQFFNRINPFFLFTKSEAFRRKFKEKGVDYEQVINKSWSNSKFGFSLLIAGALVIVLLCSYVILLFSFLIRVFASGSIVEIEVILLSILISLVIAHFAVFRKDRYLKFFQKYEESKATSNSKLILTFILVVLAPFVLILII